MQTVRRFIQWEAQLLEKLEEDLCICRSDAQGFADAHLSHVQHAWITGLTAEEACDRLIHLTAEKEKRHD